MLPDEVRAELRRAIAEGHREARNAAPVSAGAAAETPPASRYPYVGPHAAAPTATGPAVPSSPSATPAIERAWLEDRFSDIADRVEKSMARLDRHNSFETITARFDQLEQRFAVALDAGPARGGPDAGALQGIEKQITGLFAELGRTQTQLGRLDTIESRLTEVRRDPSDEQLDPPDPRRVADRRPVVRGCDGGCRTRRRALPRDRTGARRDAAREAVAPGRMPRPVADPRLGELTVLLQEFIGEYRTGDAQTAEALDTMQQAMQHLIDRVEAIEAAQITGHDELMRAAQAMPAAPADGQHEPLDFGFREQDLRPAAGALGKASSAEHCRRRPGRHQGHAAGHSRIAGR